MSEYLPALRADAAMAALADAAVERVQSAGHPQGPGIDPAMLRSTYLEVYARQHGFEFHFVDALPEEGSDGWIF